MTLILKRKFLNQYFVNCMCYTHWFLQTDCQVNHWHVGGGHTEGHASQLAGGRGESFTWVLEHYKAKYCFKLYIRVVFYLHSPIELRDDFADSFSSTSRSGDDVLAGATAIPPQLARGTIHGLLGGSDGVNCALIDTNRKIKIGGQLKM